MSADTMASGAPALPESADDELLRLQAAKVSAEVRLNIATRKRNSEEAKAAADAAQVEQAKEWQAIQAFNGAYHAWLAARAGIEEPDVPEEEQPGRFKADTDAERRLFSTPAAAAAQFWDKLTAFEAILGHELMIGLRRDSVLLLALGSLKQDIINLELI